MFWEKLCCRVLPSARPRCSSKKHLVSFLSLKEIVGKYGLRDSKLKIHQMTTKLGGKSDNFAIMTKDYWKPDPSLPEGTGRGINSMYSLAFLHCYCYMLYPLKYTRYHVVQKSVGIYMILII